MDVGPAVKEIRVKSLLSQTNFAHEIGVSFSTVNRWETGKYVPSFKALKKIKDFCSNNHIDFTIKRYDTAEKQLTE